MNRIGLAVFFVIAVCALTQETRGRIAGRVLDPKEAVVAGVDVNVLTSAAFGTVSAITSHLRHFYFGMKLIF